MNYNNYQMVEDFLYLFHSKKTSKKQKREILFILLTQYKEVMEEYFKKKKKSASFKEMEKQVKQSILKVPMITGFLEDQTPCIEEKEILLEHGNCHEKRKKLEKIKKFNIALQNLNQALTNASPNYNELKDYFTITFLDEISLPINNWIIDRFGLKESQHKRKKDKQNQTK